jgi:hypothetical protein
LYSVPSKKERVMSESHFPTTAVLLACAGSALVWLMAMVQAMPAN